MLIIVMKFFSVFLIVKFIKFAELVILIIFQLQNWKIAQNACIIENLLKEFCNNFVLFIIEKNFVLFFFLLIFIFLNLNWYFFFLNIHCR